MMQKLLTIGLLVISIIFGWIAVQLLTTTNRPKVLFDRVIIPLGKDKGYVCMGKSCVIIPRNSEFIVVLNESVNCSKHLAVYPFGELFIYGAYCDNSTVDKIMENITKI